MPSANEKSQDAFPNAETAARVEAALKRMLATPPKLHKDSRLGKRRESTVK